MYICVELVRGDVEIRGWRSCRRLDRESTLPSAVRLSQAGAGLQTREGIGGSVPVLAPRKTACETDGGEE